MTIREEALAGLPVSAFAIDSHTHLHPYYMSGWYENPGCTTNRSIIDSLGRLGIDCIVTSPHNLVAGDMTTCNEFAARAAQDFPGRIYCYIAVIPASGLDAVKAQIKSYGQNMSFVGFKFLCGYHGSALQPEYDYALAFANEMSCPVLCHTWDNNPPMQEFETIAKKYPRLKLLCAHQGGGYAKYSYMLADIMREVPNIYMETCGSLLNTLSVEELVELCGEGRVIYGSDLINLDVRFDFGRVVCSTLPDRVMRKLLAENYLSLLEGSGMGKIKAGDR